MGADSAEDLKSREVRLGLVLYGGVALAIYINGVCAEFFRAVRGRGVYRLIKALTDSDVVVDIVSGTSAGGINGIFLAYALCNQREFADCGLIWREHGGFLRLLRDPLSDPAQCVSILDSEGYYQPHIEAAFARLGPAEAEHHGHETAIQELDLFVTATDVDGKVSTEFDDAGHAIDIKDHRRVFLLKHRAGRKEPFRPGQAGSDDADGRITHRALAKLARMTSAFPGAFAPAGVGVSKDDAREVQADARLRAWGELDRAAYFLDGGVLDNKPFTHTIRQIFTRVANRAVDRKLIYVEPDPERFEPVTRGTNPNFLQAILLSLIGIPSYESIADDLRLLQARNSRLEQYGRLVRQLQPLSSDGNADKPSAESLELYRRSRLVALSRRVAHGLTAGGAANLSADQRTRAAHLVESFDRLVVDETDGSQSEELFRDFDVTFRLRRVTRMVYLLHDRLFGDSPPPAPLEREHQDLLRVLNRQSKAYEIVLSAMERLVDSVVPGVGKQGQPLEPRTIWAEVQRALRALLAGDGDIAGILPDRFEPGVDASTDRPWLPQERLDALNRALKARVERISAGVPDGAGAAGPGPSLLLRLDDLESQIIAGLLKDTRDPLRRAYAGFEGLDTYLYPLELVGDLGEKDVIETVRISPRDAQRGFSRLGLSDKVAGDALYHFAGFFKRSWRSNDILWGRLDAACQLTELLMVRDRVKAIVDDDQWRTRVRARFFDVAEDGGIAWKPSLDPKALFARSGSATQTRIAVWVEQLLSDDPAQRERALEADMFEGTVELLIEAEQLQIVGEELPNVIADAVTEEVEWNRFRNPEGMFEAAEEHFDPFVASIGAAEKVSERLRTQESSALDNPDEAPSRPIETRLGTFFRQSYRVGAEKLLRDVPVQALLEILAVALLVVRNCIIGLFGERADRVRRNPLYRFVLNPLLWAFYLLVVVSRRAPRRPARLLWWTAIVAAFALLIGLLWPSNLLQLVAGTWLVLSGLLALGWLRLRTRQLSKEHMMPAHSHGAGGSGPSGAKGEDRAHA